jgi:hypothetical protein
MRFMALRVPRGVMATADIRGFALDGGEPHTCGVVYSWEDGVATVHVSAEGENRLTARRTSTGGLFSFETSKQRMRSW